MSVFDWIRFFEDRGIPYVRGPAPDVRAGHVGIACPRCWKDSGTHYSVRISDGKVRGCWRDPTHWMAPVHLVAELASVSMADANRIYSSGKSDSESIEEVERAHIPFDELPTICLPDEFRKFTLSGNPSRLEAPFVDYLLNRNIIDPGRVANDYSLRWCATGHWSPRIIFPILRTKNEVVAWTGRSIRPATTRYKSFPPGATVGTVIWNAWRARGGRRLVVTEGVFDGLNVDLYLRRFEPGSMAVALLGLNCGEAKMATLINIAMEYDEVVIMLDANAEAQAMELADRMRPLPVRTLFIDGVAKDPAELSSSALEEVLAQ